DVVLERQESDWRLSDVPAVAQGIRGVRVLRCRQPQEAGGVVMEDAPVVEEGAGPDHGGDLGWRWRTIIAGGCGFQSALGQAIARACPVRSACLNRPSA